MHIHWFIFFPKILSLRKLSNFCINSSVITPVITSYNEHNPDVLEALMVQYSDIQQVMIKSGAFYNDLSKIHPIYVIWAPLSLMKSPGCKAPDRYTKFHEKAPQKAGTYTFTMSI